MYTHDGYVLLMCCDSGCARGMLVQYDGRQRQCMIVDCTGSCRARCVASRDIMVVMGCDSGCTRGLILQCDGGQRQ